MIDMGDDCNVAQLWVGFYFTAHNGKTRIHSNENMSRVGGGTKSASGRRAKAPGFVLNKFVRRGHLFLQENGGNFSEFRETIISGKGRRPLPFSAVLAEPRRRKLYCCLRPYGYHLGGYFATQDRSRRTSRSSILGRLRCYNSGEYARRRLP